MSAARKAREAPKKSTRGARGAASKVSRGRCSHCYVATEVDKGLVVPHRQSGDYHLCPGTRRAPMPQRESVKAANAAAGASGPGPNPSAQRPTTNETPRKRSKKKRKKEKDNASAIPVIRSGERLSRAGRALEAERSEAWGDAAREDLNYKGTSSVSDRPAGLPGHGRRR